MDSRQSFIDRMIRNRGENPGLLAQHHIWDERRATTNERSSKI
jgi:hypothetical protein